MSRIRRHYDSLAGKRDRWKKRNAYFYRELTEFYRFQIPEGTTVLEVGCGTGELLASMRPSRGVGVDISPAMVEIASKKYPDLEFRVMDAASEPFRESFDYVILSSLLGELEDIQAFLENLKGATHPGTRIIVDYYNYLWEPILKFGEWVGLKMPQRLQNWLPLEDIENLFYLAGYDIIKEGYHILLPKGVPGLSYLMNGILARMPIIRRFSLLEVMVARVRRSPEEILSSEYTCSIVIPCKDEEGNIQAAIDRMPQMGTHDEAIFVDGGSGDGTVEEIERMIREHPERDIRLIHQGDGVGKGDAVRKGFAVAEGDILMILDADLTVPPEDLSKFYDAIACDKGEFINGSRLVYPMRKGAMRFLNLLGNRLFSRLFTWILEQRFSDTLCGTKVLFRKDYERICRGRTFFGDFDPFGDFDLIFGAVKLNLKIAEVPIRYRERSYGSTKISRFVHGWLLWRMTWKAFKSFKLG
jgi:SAM-dependent methyltransferase